MWVFVCVCVCVQRPIFWGGWCFACMCFASLSICGYLRPIWHRPIGFFFSSRIFVVCCLHCFEKFIFVQPSKDLSTESWTPWERHSRQDIHAHASTLTDTSRTKTKNERELKKIELDLRYGTLLARKMNLDHLAGAYYTNRTGQTVFDKSSRNRRSKMETANSVW